VRPQTDSKRQRYESEDRFVQDWDKRQGEGQRLQRLQNRLDMGQKQTPIGNKGGSGVRKGS
jgi:hypothetical protein